MQNDVEHEFIISKSDKPESDKKWTQKDVRLVIGLISFQ